MPGNSRCKPKSNRLEAWRLDAGDQALQARSKGCVCGTHDEVGINPKHVMCSLSEQFGTLGLLFGDLGRHC